MRSTCHGLRILVRCYNHGTVVAQEEANSHVDKRLVRTFSGILQVIMQFRYSTHGLLLSELGGYLLSPDRAPAGTKRLSNLLRSQKRTWKLIAQFLWQGAGAALDEMEAAGETGLVAWDESALSRLWLAHPPHPISWANSGWLMTTGKSPKPYGA